MIRCSALQQRPRKFGSECADFTYFDAVETLFAKLQYKDLAAQAPCREITANVLMIPLLVTSLTADLLRRALETVRAQDVEEWLDEHLGPFPQKKKRAVLTAARSSNTNEGPEPA